MIRRWLLAVLILLAPLPALAQEKKPLRWGTDPTGGAPYVYQGGGGKFIGFEVDLAEYLATKLGRTSVMKKGDWDKLPELLGKPNDENGIDIVLNGYELTEDLEKKYPSTIPYYIYRHSLVIHKDDVEEIVGWTDLNRKKAGGAKRTVGVLGGSSSHDYMKSERFGDAIDAKLRFASHGELCKVRFRNIDAHPDVLPLELPAYDRGSDWAFQNNRRWDCQPHRPDTATGRRHHANYSRGVRSV